MSRTVILPYLASALRIYGSHRKQLRTLTLATPTNPAAHGRQFFGVPCTPGSFRRDFPLVVRQQNLIQTYQVTASVGAHFCH